ncbi:amidohydrolase family protein, partial [Acinetobacter baumannii]
LDPQNPEVQAIAIADGKVVRTGTTDEVMKLATPTSKVVDLNGRRVIPGLNDSHLHIIRGGLNYNMELRWEGVPSVADALRLLKEQADNT